jgi:hypothetical protein
VTDRDEFWNRQVETFGYPLVAAASNGGPYHTEAFIAGMHTSHISFMLAVAAEDQDLSDCGMVPTRVLEQLDLVALYHGYVLVHEPIEEHAGWSKISFIKMDMADLQIEGIE